MGDRQVHLGGNIGGRGRRPGEYMSRLAEGTPQSCSVALKRVGTRSAVSGFGEKCLDRKRVAHLKGG